MFPALFLGTSLLGVTDARLVVEKTQQRLKGGSGTGFAFQNGCSLRSGFSFGNIGRSNECLPLVAKGVPFCSDDNGGETCWQRGDSDANVMWHSGEVNTTQGFSDLVSAGISAEGSGWGVSASASVAFTSGHQSASNAVSFYIGASGSFTIDKIQNPAGLELSDAAAFLLKKGRWDEFFSMYGTHYVESIEYGGSFIGNIEIQSNSEANSFGISTAISGSYGAGPFSVGGSVKFGLALKNMASTTKQTATAQFTGGHTQTFNPQDAREMGDVFNQWWANVQKPGEGKPFRMFLRPLTDIGAVQLAVVESNNRTISGIFEMGSPSSVLLQKISKEWAMTNMELNTLKAIQELPCYTKSQQLRDSLNDIQRAIEAHLVTMEERMTVPLLYKLDQDLLNENDSWFVASSPTFLYKKKIEAAVKATKVCNPGARTCPMENLNLAYGNLVITPGTNDQGNWHQELRTLDECRAVCKTQPGCVAVVLQPSQNGFHYCWLKAEIKWPYAANGFVSEAAECSCFEWNVNYVDPTVVASPPSASPQDCQDQCLQNSRCNFWTWTAAAKGSVDGTPGTCWMKPGKVTGQKYLGAVSGPKKCPMQ